MNPFEVANFSDRLMFLTIAAAQHQFSVQKLLKRIRSWAAWPNSFRIFVIVIVLYILFHPCFV